jgi:8-oxo-dGTP pyrophosphatase MutT (NUDIX family)
MGAGILPISVYRGEIYVLLGLERKNNLWCDFGGSPNKGEPIFKTAIREGYEELNGILGSRTELEKLVNKNKVMKIEYDSYTSILFKTNFDNMLPIYFNNFNKYIERNLSNRNVIDYKHNGLFEKTKIKWFTLSYFIDEENKKKVRPHYVDILDSIIDNKKPILEYVKKL